MRSRIAVSTAGAVATITLGDGHRRNALGEADWVRLGAEVTRLGRRDAVRAIVLAGRDATFSAGSDLTEWVDAAVPDVERSFDAMERCFRAIELAPVPVIAAVDGIAAGAGCQLALACDLVLLDESARMGMPIARLGILASPAFVARLSSRAGAALTADLYLTGRLLSADDARAGGLVTRVVPPGEALPTACALAADLAATPASALTSAKAVLRLVTRTDPAAAAPTISYGDFHAAVGSFLARRVSA